MMNNINPFYGQQQQNIGQMNEAALMALAQQGNPQFTHAALLEQQAAQQQMQKVALERNIEVPKVNFYPSRHPDPRKARKSDIKQAYKLLRPTKRSILDPRRLFFWGNYRYTKDTGTCVIDGCNVQELIQYDNLYARICDEETGKSLWELYWQNPITGEPEAFIAREGVTSGRKLRGTYCPEHLHLYHLLNPSGISVQFYCNPESGENDLTTITFDNRMFQKELRDMKSPTQAFQEVLMAQAQQMQQAQPPPLVDQQTQGQPPLPNQQELM